MRPITIYVLAVFLFVASFVWVAQTQTFERYRLDKILRLSAFLNKVLLPYTMANLSSEPEDTELLIPIEDLPIRNIADTWGEPRSGERTHEGIDMFAKRGTAVYSATNGYIVRTGINALGGNVVFVLGSGGVRYYYAHLDSVANGITFGKEVGTTTVLGFVGNTGNAENTPSHLHFGMYKNGARNPYNLLVPRVD